MKTYECLTLQLLDTVQHIQNMQYQGIPMLQTQEIAFSRFNVVNTRNNVEGEFFWTCGFLHCLEYIIACLHMQFEANP